MRLRSWAAAFVSLAAAPAFAECHWEWLCNGEGACKQMPVCDTLYDKATPRPESSPPSPPPIRMRPHKVTGQYRALRDALEGMTATSAGAA